MQYLLRFENEQLVEACLSLTSILVEDPGAHICCSGDFSETTKDELEHFSWVWPQSEVAYSTLCTPDCYINVNVGDIAVRKAGELRFISKNDFGYSIKIRKMKKIWNEKNQKKQKLR